MPPRNVVDKPKISKSSVPRKTHHMPPAVTARVHAIANRTAAGGTIEVLALVEPFSGVMPVWSKVIITVAARNIS